MLSQDVRKNLFFEVPLHCGRGKGLALAESRTSQPKREAHGDLYYLDFGWLEKGDYRHMEILNKHGLPGEAQTSNRIYQSS